ncbi:MAG: adenylate/guanylate cyclase domain-containing protein [Spirochaetales bacterium]|nr:adenylate/guanylate cyclase domain-containing protein [Spirochaetales bacterium]
MESIDDLLRKRKELLEEIDDAIRKRYTKEVTLLFTDIVGSTTYFEEMGDIAGREMIQTHNDLLFPIITAHGGTVIKTIGDSIMASFADPGRAVEGAVAMQRALEEYNRTKNEQHRIRVRMGLHYGEAVVDDRGTSGDLFGDMVNTSARVESKAEGAEIIISASLCGRVGSSGIPTVHLGSEPIKGKKEKLDLYLVNWNGRTEEEILVSWQRRAAPPPPEARPASGVRAPRVVVKGNVDLKDLAKKIPPPAARGNPYLNRVMIPHEAMFFGRRALVKRIAGRIGAARPQSVSVVGERRIGKSSLLNYLNFPSVRLALLDRPESLLHVFIDFQQLRATGPDDIIAVIFKELERSLGDRIEIAAPADFDGMRLLAEAVKEAGLKLVLFCDEFESVTKNEKIKPDFYSYFRSLANNYPLAFVAASGRNLKDMCVTHEISDSPFFNIFAVQHVGLFSEDEAKELVTVPSAAAGAPLAPLADGIIGEAGRYPFFLQMLCSSWYEYLTAEEKAAADFSGKRPPREVLDVFREEAEPHFEYVAETWTDEERAFMRDVVGEKAVDPAAPACEQLCKRGYLVERSDGSPEPFSAQFGLFLKKHFTR